MLRFKTGVRIRIHTAQLAGALYHASMWSEQSRVDVEINSVNDGDTIHQQDSLHGYDLAVDLDTVGDQASDLTRLWMYLRRVLDPQYDVVFEGDHVHVEWDARRGKAPAVT